MALKQWVVRLAVCFAVAVVSSCSTWIWAPPLFRPTPPPAALTTGLSGKWSVVSGEFDRRVKAAFPVGTPIGQMAADLQRQGFTRQDWDSSNDEEHEAVRREDNIVCRQAAYVHWRTDGEGRLTAVRGTYEEEGCV